MDWELMLRSEQEVTEDITHVGIRGHWMRPATKAGENTMEVQVEEYIENTFEHQYLFVIKGLQKAALCGGCARKRISRKLQRTISQSICIFHQSM